MNSSTTSATAAITSQQLADLLALSPSALCHHPELPPAHPVHSGRPGKPQHAIELAALAQFAYDQTAHLTEAECRLRLALARRTEPARTRGNKFAPFYTVLNEDGTLTVRPLLGPNDLTFQEQRDLRAALIQQEQLP